MVYLGVIFQLFSVKTYIEIPHHNRLIEAVLMRGYNMFPHRDSPNEGSPYVSIEK